MSDSFRIVVAGIVTNGGEVLIGRKEEVEGHPISGQWHFPGGRMDRGENVEEAARREIKEETGLEVEIHQLVDVYRGMEDMVRVIFHCEASNRDAEAEDDLEAVKWVSPGNLADELGKYDSEIVADRPRISNFVEKLKKLPNFS